MNIMLAASILATCVVCYYRLLTSKCMRSVMVVLIMLYASLYISADPTNVMIHLCVVSLIALVMMLLSFVQYLWQCFPSPGRTMLHLIDCVNFNLILFYFVAFEYFIFAVIVLLMIATCFLAQKDYPNLSWIQDILTSALLKFAVNYGPGFLSPFFESLQDSTTNMS